MATSTIKDSLYGKIKFDEIVATGFDSLDSQLEDKGNCYYLAYIGGSAGDRPAAYSFWIVIGGRNATGLYAFQVALTWDYAIYKRTKSNSSTWGAWKSVTLS